MNFRGWFDNLHENVPDWWRWVPGLGFGYQTVTCPYCGRVATYRITIRDGGQVVSCRNCWKNFRIIVHQGRAEVLGTRP
jgi:hypothetical protein